MEDVEVLKQEIINGVTKKLEEKLAGEKVDVNKIVQIVKAQILEDKSFLLTAKKDEEVPGTLAKGIKKALGEGTGASGGYLVPISYVNKIIDITKVKSLILQYADIMPVATNQASVPVLDSDVTFYWTNENTEGTESNPTFKQLNAPIKKGMAITPIPNELLDDETIGGAVDAYLEKLFGRALAKEIDRVALTGNKGNGDPFDGVINTSGVVVVTGTSTSDPEYKKLVEATFAISDDYASDPLWVAHRTFYSKCFQLESSDGKPVLSPEAKALVAYPFVRNERMPHTFTTGQPIALFGDLSNVRIAMRQGLTIEASKQVNFKSDQTVLRAKFRMGLGVTPADAFVLYKLG